VVLDADASAADSQRVLAGDIRALEAPSAPGCSMSTGSEAFSSESLPD